MWQTPPEGTWQARQQRLDWLGLAMSDAKEMFLGLRRHWNLLEHQFRITEAVDIMKVWHTLSLITRAFVVDCFLSLQIFMIPSGEQCTLQCGIAILLLTCMLAQLT